VPILTILHTLAIQSAVRRTTDLHERLISEGIVFNGAGRAGQQQRMTANSLKEQLAEEAEEAEADGAKVAKWAWMVRGANVDGYDVVQTWLREGFVSLSESQLSKGTAYWMKGYRFRAAYS
jgi:5-methylcytosine-specific restriction enzyme B